MKYNWELMKEEYIIGDIPSVLEYMKKQYGKFAPAEGTIRSNTVGWKKEREAYQAELTKRIKEELEDKKARLATEQLEKMLETKSKLIDIVKEYFAEGNAYEYVEYTDSSGQKKKRMKLLVSSAELKNMWQIIKAEVGEPVTIPAESKETKDKLTIPKGGVFGIKQLMVSWREKNKDLVVDKVNTIEGEIITDDTQGAQEDAGTVH